MRQEEEERSYVEEPAAIYGGSLPRVSTSTIIELIKEGLPFRELERLRRRMDVTTERIAKIVGMSRSTLNRRKKEGTLSQFQSEKVVRLEQLYAKAVATFEDEELAKQWMLAPVKALGEEAPLDYAETEIGAREVENLLGRLEHGVFS